MVDSPKKRAKWTERLSMRVQRVLFMLLMYAVLLMICIPAISPEQYDLAAGDVAPKTITASKDIVDEISTQRKRSAAAAAVSPVYYKDETVSEQVLREMEEAFTELRSVRELGAQILAARTQPGTSFSEADYQRASAMLTGLTLSNYQMRTLMSIEEADFEALYQSLISATRTMLVSNINEGQINDAINSIQQIVSYNTRTDLWYNVAIPTLRACLKPNMLIDQEATEINRQKASEAVEPIVYKQDQNIVVKGDRVTAEQMAVLEDLALLRGNRFDLGLYAGAALMIVLILAAGYVFMLIFLPGMRTMGSGALVLVIADVLCVGLSLLIGRYVGMTAMPTMLAAVLVSNLLGTRAAYLANLIVTMVMAFLTVKGTGLAASQLLSVVMMTLVGGSAVICLLRRNASRMNVIMYTMMAGAANFVLIGCVGMLMSSDWGGILRDAMQTLLGALLSAVLCVGIQPMLESWFNLVTPSKLIELSNPNQPLLRRLMIETPGTYHHSMVVANLAEAAAEAVGANAAMVRVGAYYHDIGKLVRPLYFKENQMGENPHDKTDPRVSAAILTEHTCDGVELAKKHHLPEAVVDMIRQHHGDTPAMYFYAKSVQQFGQENVDIADFRYDGPKPQTAEAAILMLSDTVEAAVRSISEPTQEKISQMIRKLVRGKMEDGQLDECTLTFRDIGKICAAYETVLKGVFHERIEYPSVEIGGSGRKAVKAAENAKPQQEKKKA